jgi:hypothetical protein
MKFRRLRYKDFKRYFHNNMEEKDKHDFEKRIMQDAFEEEAYDGLSSLEKEEMEQDVNDLKSRINKRTKGRRIIPYWFRYAAGVLILLAVGFSVYILNDQFQGQKLLKEPLPSVKEKQEKEQKETKSRVEPEKSEKQKQKKEKKETKVQTDKKEQTGAVAEINVMQEQEEEQVKTADQSQGISKKTEKKEKENKTAAQKTKSKEEKEKEESELTIVEFDSDISVSEIRTARKEQAEKKPQKKSNKLKTISGKVLSMRDSSKIPGVSITLKNDRTIGTSTDMDGSFTLQVPAQQNYDSLEASFVGLENKIFSIGQDTNLLVMMEPSQQKMEEVVVTSYGKQSLKNKIKSIFTSNKTEAQPPKNWTIKEFREKVKKQIDYNSLSEFKGEHQIKIKFTVKKDGSLTGFNVRGEPGDAFAKELKETIKNTGKWIPAKKDGEKTESTVKIEMQITVENNEQ